MHPAMRDQEERPAGWNIVAEIHFDIMIARHALILAATESVQVLAVEDACRTPVTSLPLSSTARAIGCGVSTVVIASLAGGITKRSST